MIHMFSWFLNCFIVFSNDVERFGRSQGSLYFEWKELILLIFQLAVLLLNTGENKMDYHVFALRVRGYAVCDV